MSKPKLKTMTYWVAEVMTGSKAYNVRMKTKRDVENYLRGEDYIMFDNKAWGFENDSGEAVYTHGPVHKVLIGYWDRHDLVFMCLGEGSIDEGVH